jgi:hypothetical protein
MYVNSILSTLLVLCPGSKCIYGLLDGLHRNNNTNINQRLTILFVGAFALADSIRDSIILVIGIEMLSSATLSKSFPTIL